MDRLTSNIVPPVGPMTAKICFIGQAPGEEEDHALEPFVGSAGQLFNRCLKAVGIIRSEVLINNLFCQRPPGNDVHYYYEDKSCTRLTWEGQEHVDRLAAWLRTLLDRRESGLGGPNIIVAMGAEAAQALTGHTKITKIRGSMYNCILVPGFKVYCTNHPSYINRLMNEPEERIYGLKKIQKLNALPLFLRDLDRIREQSDTIELPVTKREFHITGTFSDYMDRIIALNNVPIISCDIETIRTPLGTIVWCIGFSPRPDYAFTLPILRNMALHWSIREESMLWQEVSKVFLNENVLKIFHNGGYDLSVLGRYYGLRLAKGTWEDTMWLFQATYPDLTKALHILTSIYTWEPYYKEDGKYWDGRRISDDAEFIYNCRDCAVTREVYDRAKKDAQVQGTVGNYERHMRVLPSHLSMMINGVLFDEEGRDNLAVEFGAILSDNLEIIKAETEMNINPGSSAQLQRLLYGYYGMPTQYNHKTKKPCVDKDAINRLRKKYPKHTVLKAISEYKKYEKLVSTYTTLQADTDKRIRTNYQFVSTFRTSSSESHFGGGGNLQNIPTRTKEGKLVRRLFIPDPGYEMGTADFKQAEAQEVAYLSDDIQLIEDFAAGVDVHWEGARRLFDIPSSVIYDKSWADEETFLSPIIGEPKTLKELRDMGKTVEHATNYDMGPLMLQNILIRQEIFLELALCKRLLSKAKQGRPMRVKWHQSIIEEINTTRTLVNAFGDRREFRGRLGPQLYRSGFAYKPQSTVGRLLEFAMQRVFEEVEAVQVLLNVHDEIVFQYLIGTWDEIKPQIERQMLIPHMVNGRGLIIGVDFKKGPNWAELKEI